MAKLNVVIPAVDVMVDGQTYRKVDRKAQAGDIVKALDNLTDITAGAFYLVYPKTSGELAFNDNVDDARPAQLRGNAEYYEVYEAVTPITEPAAQPSETITFENATYRKVKRSAREGDIIVITEAPFDDYDITPETPYKVTRVDSSEDPHITDDGGLDYDTSGDALEVYEKVADESAEPTVEYREVKRWAERGERIRIVNRDSDEQEYEQGAEFIVNDVDGDGDVRVTAGGHDHKLVLLEEYVVLEPLTSAVPTKYSVGNYVKVTGNSVGHNYAEGSIVKITFAEDLSGETRQKLRAEKADGTTGNWLVTNDVEPANKPKPARLTVGDYAKVIADSAGMAKIGAVIKITKDRCGMFAYDGTYADGTELPVWMRESEVEPATEAEFLAQRKPAEPVRLKVGEYAKTVDSSGDDRAKVGDIAEVTDVLSDSLYYVKTTDGRSYGMFSHRFVLATAEEVAEAKAEAERAEKERAEIAKWAAINRKVGEIKRGDIVQTFMYECGHPAGTVGIAQSDGTADHTHVVVPGELAYTHEVKLITPVEQRFDAPTAA